MAKAISQTAGHVNGQLKMVQVDVTEPDSVVEVEWDNERKVLYVHMEGYTILRMCRVNKGFRFKKLHGE